MPLSPGIAPSPEAESMADLLRELRAIRLGMEILADEDLIPADEEVEE